MVFVVVEIEVLKGNETRKYLRELGEFRIEQFRVFPYLYQGSLENEQSYLERFAENSQAVLFVAKVGAKIVGVATVVPLVSETEIFKGSEEQFRQAGWNAKDFYYFGELIIEPKYRGQKIASLMLKQQEALVKELGYGGACFLVVERAKDHPLRPQDYQEPDQMWNHLGYRKTTISLEFEWPTIQDDGAVLEVKNKMMFWVKELD